jgi:hypothetical protein
MGQSTNAIVFYGYIWDDEGADVEFDLDDAVDAIYRARGHVDPWDARPEDVSYRDWAAGHKAEIDEWRAIRVAIDAEFLVGVGQHCSDSASMPYVFIRSTEVTAYRGSPKPLMSLDVDPAWRGQLDAFLTDNGIEAPEGENQPGWWTCSWWGC